MREKDLKTLLTDNLSVSVETAGKAFGLGRNAAYAAVKNGQIPSIKLGKKIAVPTAAIRRMLGIENQVA